MNQALLSLGSLRLCFANEKILEPESIASMLHALKKTMGHTAGDIIQMADVNEHDDDGSK
jgi:hypothetical protein